MSERVGVSDGSATSEGVPDDDWHLRRAFGSDNFSGIHPEVLEAIARANVGHATSYGDDPITERATALFREHFGSEASVFFTFNGTGANVVGLQSMLRPWQGVICSANSHIYVDECAAPERFLGSKLIPLPAADGKLTPQLAATTMVGIGDEHRVQPRVVSVTESTELGTAYTIEELGDLADWAHGQGLLLHLDGARLSNAAAFLGVELDTFRRCGVDLLSFGGTKNGALAAEAVVSFLPDTVENLRFIRKQSMQLASKMRFVAAQFIALLSDDLWKRNASHANAMARRLADSAGRVPLVEIVQPVEANGVFASIPRSVIASLQEEFRFYVWDTDQRPNATGHGLGRERDIVRWMASFDTTPEDVDAFGECIKRAASTITDPAAPAARPS